jgi:hypothetical protein
MGSSFSLVEDCGESEVEARAFAGFRLGPDEAAMPVDDALADRQAYARTGDIGLPVQPLEYSEHPFGIPLVEPDAVVANGESPKVIVPLGADLDSWTVFGLELQRVADDVLE